MSRSGESKVGESPLPGRLEGHRPGRLILAGMSAAAMPPPRPRLPPIEQIEALYSHDDFHEVQAWFERRVAILLPAIHARHSPEALAALLADETFVACLRELPLKITVSEEGALRRVDIQAEDVPATRERKIAEKQRIESAILARLAAEPFDFWPRNFSSHVAAVYQSDVASCQFMPAYLSRSGARQSELDALSAYRGGDAGLSDRLINLVSKNMEWTFAVFTYLIGVCVPETKVYSLGTSTRNPETGEREYYSGETPSSSNRRRQSEPDWHRFQTTWSVQRAGDRASEFLSYVFRRQITTPSKTIRLFKQYLSWADKRGGIDTVTLALVPLLCSSLSLTEGQVLPVLSSVLSWHLNYLDELVTNETLVSLLAEIYHEIDGLFNVTFDYRITPENLARFVRSFQQDIMLPGLSNLEAKQQTIVRQLLGCFRVAYVFYSVAGGDLWVPALAWYKLQAQLAKEPRVFTSLGSLVGYIHRVELLSTIEKEAVLHLISAPQAHQAQGLLYPLIHAVMAEYCPRFDNPNSLFHINRHGLICFNQLDQARICEEIDLKIKYQTRFEHFFYDGAATNLDRDLNQLIADVDADLSAAKNFQLVKELAYLHLGTQLPESTKKAWLIKLILLSEQRRLSQNIASGRGHHRYFLRWQQFTIIAGAEMASLLMVAMLELFARKSITFTMCLILDLSLLLGALIISTIASAIYRVAQPLSQEERQRYICNEVLARAIASISLNRPEHLKRRGCSCRKLFQIRSWNWKTKVAAPMFLFGLGIWLTLLIKKSWRLKLEQYFLPVTSFMIWLSVFTYLSLFVLEKIVNSIQRCHVSKSLSERGALRGPRDVAYDAMSSPAAGHGLALGEDAV